MVPLSSQLGYNIPAMTLFSSIDVGSNTLRLLVGEFVDDRIRDVLTERDTTRLGNLVSPKGMIQPESMEASLRTLRGFASAISRLHVKHVKALGTSALREAGNAGVFMQRVQEATGIQIEIISGEEEARLTLRGILHAFATADADTAGKLGFISPHDNAGHLHRKPLFVMDIGGGSTEWIRYQGQDRQTMGSLPCGVIKLAQQCITADPPSHRDIIRLDREIGPMLNRLGFDADSLSPEKTLYIGTGGTFTAIASVDLGLIAYSREGIHLHRIPLTRLRQMQERFLRLSLMDRKNIRGLEPGRADLIIPGVQFTMKVMELFRFQELIISDYGLLEGALLEMKEAYDKSIPEAAKS